MVECCRCVSVAAFTLSFLFFLVFLQGGLGQDDGVLMFCNFENATDAFCGYTQEENDDFDWTINSGRTSSSNTGPEVDHTYGTETGNYIYTESSRPQTTGHIARLASPMMSPSSTPICFSFYYQMNGEDVGKLQVRLRVGNQTDETVLKEWRGHQGTEWLKAGITINPQAEDYRIILESEVGEGYRGDVALDDLSVLDKVCPIESLMCSFETPSICGFRQDQTDDFDFRRNSGTTRSWYTGPRNDNTYKNESGFYMYIEASYRQQGHVARLISPMMAGHGGEPSCLIFYYHMYGTMIGGLKVHIKNSTSPGLGNPIWALDGNRGDRWRAAEAVITTPEDYQVVFAAERGESSQGDIAIDDVNITFTECPGHHHIKNFSSVNCDFEEKEICYYTQDKDDEFDWTWANRGTWWRFTGPEVDHTLGNELGFFMYIDARWYTPRNAAARLTSPEVSSQRRPSCLEFWYHMYGNDVEELNVYIKPSNGQLPSEPSWTTSGDQGDYWHRATVDITMLHRPFKVVFEGKRGESQRDDIALDDVHLYEGSDCPPYPTDLPPRTTTPRPVSDLQCTFEEDDCNFVNAYNDVFDWVRHQGRKTWSWWMDTIHKDHTLGTKEGYYMALHFMWWWWHQTDDKAILYSPLIQGSSTPRCLSFYFVHNGRYADYFNIYIVKHGDTLSFDPDLFFYGDHGPLWKQAFLDIPPSTYPFYVVFEGVIGHMWATTETAIDDITLQRNKCIRPTPTTLPISADCDFEDTNGDGLCNYVREERDYYWWQRPYMFHWEINMGSTTSLTTGPKSDHTFMNASGHYLYAEASQPQRPGDYARITTPVLAATGERICLQFFYHMTGSEIGQLSVKWNAPRFAEKVLFWPKKMAGRWQSAYVDINDIVDKYTITFEAVVGSGNKGDIAIDDIKFLRQPCSGFEPESTCAFDGDYESCNYRQAYADLLAWIWFDSISSEPSPLGNASVGSFLYIRGDPQVPSNKAVLYPPKVPTKQMDHCLSYDVTVQNDPAVNLVVAIEYENSQWRKIQTVNSTNAGKWTHFDVNLDLSILTDNNFQLKFAADLGNKTTGIIAIDNITISQATCDVVKARTSARGDQKGGGSKASTALGIILTLVIIGVVLMLVAAWYYIRRSGGELPFAIKYKNSDNDNANPVSLPGEPGIANPVYDKPTLDSA